MKTVIKVCIFTFLLAFVGTFILAFSFINIFYDFELVSANVLLYTSLIVASIISIFFVIVVIVLIKSEKKTKMEHWLSINGAKLTLAYILLLLFFQSVQSEVFLNIEEMKELLSLEWVILGISITTFLIWNVVTIEYLQKKKPQKPQSSLPTKTWLYLQDKENFYSNATSLLSSVYLLLVNLAVICIATVNVYVTSKSAMFFSQCIVIFGLYLSTNTIIGLILDILKPFNEKKKSMLEETKTTGEDIELQNAINKDTGELLIAIEAINKLQSIDDEEKNKVKSDLLRAYITKYENESNIPKLNVSDKDDQL